MTRLTRIGNSQGIRIPKPLIAQANLENNKLDLEVVEEGLLIKPILNTRRKNWKSNIESVLLKNKDKKRIYPFLIRFLKDSEDILGKDHFIVNINYLLLSQHAKTNEERAFYNRKSDYFLKNSLGFAEGKIVKFRGMQRELLFIWSDILMTSFRQNNS